MLLLDNYIVLININNYVYCWNQTLHHYLKI